MLEKIILIRNIFYKCFLIGLVYLIFVTLFYLFNKEWLAGLTSQFYNISKENLYMLMIYFISWSKMAILYIFLIPALALHWTGALLKKEQEKV